MTGSPFRRFAAPPSYVQGPGAIDILGELITTLGDRPIVVTDRDVWRVVGSAVHAALGEATSVLRLEGQITPRALDQLTAQARDLRPDVIVAVGGGKALDAGKAVARNLGAKIATVPTIASNDAPTSRSIALYDDEDGRFLVETLGRNPDLVVVDSLVIASAPAHFLRCGIGDGIAKFAEAEGAAASPSGLTPLSGAPTLAGLALARAARDTLHADAATALALAGTGETNPAFERVLEAVVLLSGLGFENGGLGVAHGMTRGLILADRTRRHSHGEQVAYGLLVMLALEADGKRLHDERLFLQSVGLPDRLTAFSAEAVTSAEIEFLAEKAMTAPQHMLNYGRSLDAAAISAAIRRVEGLDS